MGDFRELTSSVGGGERGFTLAELVVAVAITGLIVAPCVTIYLATLDSWEGTAALADVQRRLGVKEEPIEIKKTD